MNNKIEITKVLKNSDEYTEEELKSGKLYQVGLEYNGKIYYFSKPVGVCKDLALVFNTLGENPDYPAVDSIKVLYEEHRKAFNEINMDYQTNSSDTQTIFTKVKNDEINYTKKEEKVVKKELEDKKKKVQEETEKEFQETPVVAPIKNVKVSKKGKSLIAGGLIALAIFGGVIIGTNFDKIKNIFKSNKITNDDLNEDNIRKVTVDFTKNFNKLCDEKANSKTLKLQITEEETRLFYLFVNYKNYTEEQIANVFGEITNPSEVARKITNFVTQVTKYEGLTNEKVDINSLLINNNSKKEYENFKELIEKDEVSKAFNKYSSNNATYLDYINANNYSKLNKAEKESLASIYGASLERFKEFVINVNYLARINNLVNKFNSNTLTKEDLELREAPISKGNKDTYNDLLKDHGIDKVTTKTETITKDEAIKDFGSDKVKDAENKADQELNDKNKSEQERADQIESDYNKKIKETIDEIIKKGVNKDGLYDIPSNASPEVRKELENMNEQLRKAMEAAKKDNDKAIDDALKNSNTNTNTNVTQAPKEEQKPNLDYNDVEFTGEYISQEEYEKWLQEANMLLDDTLEKGTTRSR
ncbi:MAG TPA: hypothetical protein OIM65_02175 [Bacilli bacterium]|nr:hypothetical protein [Bacilli bacterium]